MSPWHFRRALAWLNRPAVIPFKVRRWARLRRAAPAYREALARDDLLVEAGPLPSQGLISVAMPVFRVSEAHLRAAVASVVAQSWPHWELVVVDDAAPDPHVAKVLEEAASDPRVRVVRRATNGGISVASNDAVTRARGDFVAFLDHDDELHPRALELAARLLARHPETDWLFTDEDKIDQDGRYCEPIFKPGWSRHLLLAFNVVSHFRVVRRGTIDRVGGHRVGCEGAQDYDLALRILGAGGRFAHLPGPLYHWRSAKGSMARLASAKPRANSRAAAALLEHARGFPRGGEATAEVLVEAASLFHVRRVAEDGLSLAVAVPPGTVSDPRTWMPHSARPVPVSDLSPATLVAVARSSSEDVLLVPPPLGIGKGALAELLALLQVPGTAVAAGRLVTGRRIVGSGCVATDAGELSDPLAGIHVFDPGYLNLALLPGRRLVPPPFGWAVWRSHLLEAWDAASDAPEQWRLAVGWARLGLEVVTTPGASFHPRTGDLSFPPLPIPAGLPAWPVVMLARLGLLP